MNIDFEQSFVEALSPADIDDLILDSEIRLEGGIVHYVVDPADMQRFCFPIKPTEQEKINLFEIGTHQIGLYEVFYRSEPKPILAEEYVQEVRLILEWFVKNANAAYSGMEMVDELLRLANYDERGFRELLQSRGVEAAVAEKGLRFLLSIVLGIHSYAIHRLAEVFRDRLDKGLSNMGAEVVGNLADAYVLSREASPRYCKIMDINLRFANRAGRSIRHAEFDAKVIDRLFFLNSLFEEAFKSGQIKTRRVFLYVSSAARSRKLFRNPEIMACLPNIRGANFSFWRDSRQLFVLAVSRAAEENGEDYLKTIENLKNFKHLLEDIQISGGFARFKDRKRCDECWLEGKKPPACEWGTVCDALREVRDAYEGKRELIEDAHLATKLKTYSEVAQPVGEEREEKYGVLLKAIRQLQDPRIGDALVKRALEIQRIIEVSGDFVSELPEGTSNIFAEQAFEDMDAVTASSQFFPRRAKIISREHAGIWDAVLRFFDLQPHGEMRSRGAIPDRSESRSHVIFAFSEFLRLEVSGIPEQVADHELTRCLLYLSFVTREHSQRSFDLAMQNAKKFLVREAEFIYVALWAGRRSGFFEKTDKLAREAISKFPSDFRFYHAAQLNVFSWIRAGGKECPYSLRECVTLSEKAVTLLLQGVPIDADMLAANYNNLAFVSVLDDGDDSAFDLVRARSALKSLKSCLDKDGWSPLYPEYHHTEAHLELKEAGIAFAGGDIEGGEAKLKCAFEDSRKAMEIFPNKIEHRRTFEEIESLGRVHGVVFPRDSLGV